jgi:hypothetical protein
MSYVLVSADFPDVTTTQRDTIYKCLDDKKWIKVRELGRDISTTWYASFEGSVTEIVAIEITISDFVNCSKPYCKPKLVIHWGPNKPTFYGLV